MELTLDFVQFQVLKRKNKCQITSFGYSFFRQICFSLYLFRPEILSSIMDTKSFFRFISTEVLEDIVSSFEEEKREEKGIGKDETLKKEDFLLSSELSPWIHNFAYSKMDNLISLAIEVISDSKCSLFHANEKEKAVQFLVKVSGKHPLLFIRHFPVFVCRIATYLFRRKGGDFYTVRRKNILTMYERNKDEAKEMEGEEEDKEREEEMVSFTATGMKGEGSSCKVFFNVTSSHVFVENLLWKTLIKCLKKANIRSLNQEVEEAVKKLAASSCIQF